MLRSGASRSILRSLNIASNPAFKVTSSPVRQQLRSQLCTVSRRPQLVASVKPLAPQTLRWQSQGDRKPIDNVDPKREEKIAKGTLEPHPELVSTSSSVTPAIGMSRGEDASAGEHVGGGVMSDLQTIRETFSLAEVPRQAYWMGMAGVIPYAVTSMATVVCAFEINHASEAGAGYLMSEKTAEALLHVIEPIQVGYGAVILSFLGAVHWGLEWAQYGGQMGYPRYFIGVVSTAVAWPTLLMPIEYALITQFLAFNFLYYTDERAKTRGWAPPWYGVYRFVLTFIVGGSIVVSLIGRGQIADRIHRQPSATDRIRAFRDQAGSQMEEEEEARARFLAEKDEEEDDDDE